MTLYDLIASINAVIIVICILFIALFVGLVLFFRSHSEKMDKIIKLLEVKKCDSSVSNKKEEKNE